MATTAKIPRLQQLHSTFFEAKELGVYMLRLDEIHPLVSGNKWYKLKYVIDAMKQSGKSSLLTFGGAYSNHLLATAAFAKENGFKSIGVIRGIHGSIKETSTITNCRALGMDLQFISRASYGQKEERDFLTDLQQKYPDAFLLPEGGANTSGQRGAAEIADFIPEDTSLVCLPVGTGTTLIGIRKALAIDIPILGFTAMKGGTYLQVVMDEHLSKFQQRAYALMTEYSYGGFGKRSPSLLSYMKNFQETHDIRLDLVYTAKMMMGMDDLAVQDFFPKGSKIVAIHTGGLQGNPPGY